MRAEIDPNGDFVKKWIEIRKKEQELDQLVFDLIERHLKIDGTLDEKALLKSLLAYSEELGRQ